MSGVCFQLGDACGAAATFMRFSLPEAPRPGLPVLWASAHRPPSPNTPPASIPRLVGETLANCNRDASEVLLFTV